MSTFTKLSSSLIHSTIWREADHVRIVWITMLALADRDGIVEASIPGLADAARVTLEQAQDALNILSSPDAFSRNPANEGRRIAPSTEVGGWVLLNYGAHRARLSAEETRRRTAARVQKHRDKKKRVTPAALPTVTVTQVTENNANAEAEAEAEADLIRSGNQISDLDPRSMLQSLPRGRGGAREPARESAAAGGQGQILDPGLPETPAGGAQEFPRPRGLDLDQHPDEFFTNRVDQIPIATYVPSQWLVNAAMDSGLNATAFSETLQRYRQKARLANASQSAHDQAFRGWLRRSNFETRREPPGSERPPEAADKRPSRDQFGAAASPPKRPKSNGAQGHMFMSSRSAAMSQDDVARLEAKPPWHGKGEGK